MKLTPNNQTRRTGFTLIELMVVVVIIALIAGLLTAATIKALAKGKQVRCKTEISELSVAVQNFYAKFGFYPPSQIKLCEKLSYYGATTFDTESINTIRRMFPRIDMTIWGSASPTVGIDWNGNNVIDPATAASGPVGVTILEGDQCLVFFLGGIPANTGGPPGCTGFSTNAGNPAAHVSTGGPTMPLLFEFPSSRLILRSTASGNFFYSFLDPYGSSNGSGGLLSGLPYAYFSAYNNRNGYNRYFSPPAFAASDCFTLGTIAPNGVMVWPYAEALPALGNTIPAPRYINPETFQIISAGPDGAIAGGGFGSGTVLSGQVNPPGDTRLTGPGPIWTQATAGTVYATGNAGADDQSNFSDTYLGSGG
jgi:prepilin-type N-terminal cleavage/methylation domain-containing protein